MISHNGYLIYEFDHLIFFPNFSPFFDSLVRFQPLYLWAVFVFGLQCVILLSLIMHFFLAVEVRQWEQILEYRLHEHFMPGCYFLPRRHGDARKWRYLLVLESLIPSGFQHNSGALFQVAAGESQASQFWCSRQHLLPMMLLSMKIVTLPPISFLNFPKQIDWWSLSWET